MVAMHESTTTNIAPTGNQGGMRMWPSLETASRIYDGANITLVLALAFGVVATILIVWMGNVKEEYLRERIASLDLARVKLEVRIADRKLTQVQQNELTRRLTDLKEQHGTVIASPSTPESEWFARILTAPLVAAGWKMEILPGTPTATVLQPTGVVIQYAIDPELPLREGSKEAEAAERLAIALNELGIDATAVPGLMKPPQTIEIVISAK